MILRSVAVSVLFGFVFGILYSLFKVASVLIIYLLRKALRLPSIRVKRSTLFQNFFDCTFVVVIGISYIVLSYILLDGVFDIYSIISLVASFLLTTKVFASILRTKLET